MTAERVQAALEMIMRLASGELDARATLSGENDELDGLIAGINMLAEELEARDVDNARLLADMQQKVAIISAQYETIKSLSTPVLMVWDGVLVLPVVGVLDTERASILTERLLDRVSESGARVAIIDVTGVAFMDTAVAAHIIRSFDAVKLLGAQCILTGLSPENAMNMTKLGVTLANVTVRSTLHAGLRAALSINR